MASREPSDFSKFKNRAAIQQPPEKVTVRGVQPPRPVFIKTEEVNSIMNVDIIHEIGKNPTLEILVADLEIANQSEDLPPISTAKAIIPNTFRPPASGEWPILKAINATPALTLIELKLKARAAEIELERDAEYCEGPGSFIEMTRSHYRRLVRDGFHPRGPFSFVWSREWANENGLHPTGAV